jgi:signal transduction histidine kinase
MAAVTKPGQPASRPGKIITAGVYLLCLAVVIRTLANPFVRARLPVYLALEFLFLVLFTLALFRPIRKSFWKHFYFLCQSLIVLILIWLRPRFDFIVVLFIPLSFQAVLLFSGRRRWVWVTLLTILTGLPLILALGLLQGLALALMPMTICIVFPAYVSVSQEIEAGVQRNEALLRDLREANRQLTQSAGQVEELSAIQERNRLARELHDSVSQTMFSISLHTRAAQILLDIAPDRVRLQLEQLKTLTHSALDEMRSLIAELRPADAGSAIQTTTQDSSH